MSFSHQVKQELTSTQLNSNCCNHALAYGMLLFGRSFSSYDISLLTKYETVANEYLKICEKDCGIKPTLTITKSNKYILSFNTLSIRKKVLQAYSCTGKEAIARINLGNLSNETISEDENLNCCNAAFLKGVFLSCGTVCDPDKSYHLEFVVPFKKLGEDLLRMLEDYELKAKHILRRGVHVIYIKDSSSIEDLLTIMGATGSALEIMSVKMYKDYRNLINRQTNFDAANIVKTANASYDQVMAIENIKENGLFVTLSQELKQLATLRTQHTDASLRQIGEMMSPPLSRSAVNNRLNKFIAMSKKINDEKMMKADKVCVNSEGK